MGGNFSTSVWNRLIYFALRRIVFENLQPYKVKLHVVIKDTIWKFSLRTKEGTEFFLCCLGSRG